MKQKVICTLLSILLFFAHANAFAFISFAKAMQSEPADSAGISEYQRLKSLYGSGEEKAAIKQANQYLEEHPKDLDVRLALGQFYMEEKRYKDAETELGQVVEKNPRYLDARLVLANTEIRLKNYDKALNVVNDGLEYSPNNKALLKKKADVLDIKKSASLKQTTPVEISLPAPIFVQKKIGVIDANLDGSKEDQTEYQRLLAMNKSGQKRKAISQAKRYLKQNPENLDVRLALGKFYLEQKKYKKASAELRMVLLEDPTYLDARLLLINSELSLGRREEAIILIDEGLSIDPNNELLLKKKIKVSQIEVFSARPVLPKPKHYFLENTKKHNPLEYRALRDLYRSGQRRKAILKAKRHLEEYPNDVDVRLALGQFYLNEGDYSAAQRELRMVLKTKLNYLDARLVLINAEIKQENYARASFLVDEGLALNPGNEFLFKKQQDIRYINQSFFSTGLEPNKVEIKKPYREVGLWQQNYNASDLSKVWNYTSVYFLGNAPFGKVLARANYASRLGRDATQGEVRAYPVISKRLYLELGFGYANEPNIFPDRTYLAEAYFSNPKFIDFSIGAQYKKIDALRFFRTYTGSLSKDFGNNRISFRPYHFVPGAGPKSTLGVVDLRHFVRGNPNRYFGVKFGGGTSPDLANLQTINFIKLKNRIAGAYIGFPLMNERLLVNINAAYDHQKFPNGKIRDLTGGGISLAYRF